MEMTLAANTAAALIRAGDPVSEWHQHLAREVAAGQMAADTSETYRRGLEKFKQWGEARIEAGANLDRLAVLEWIAELRSAGKAPKSIAVWLGGTRAFFQWALSEGRIPADPTAGVKAGKRSNTRRHSRDRLSDEEIARLMELASLSKRDRALIFLALYTAARSIELHRADIEDLKTAGEQMIFYVQGKGRIEKDDVLVIASRIARNAIRDYLAELSEAGHRAGALFVTERCFDDERRRISRRTLRRAVRNAFDAAGIIEPTKTTHSLRHSAISKIVENTGDIRIAQKVARHSSVTTTEIYAHELSRLGNPGEAHIKYGLAGE